MFKMKRAIAFLMAFLMVLTSMPVSMASEPLVSTTSQNRGVEVNSSDLSYDDDFSTVVVKFEGTGLPTSVSGNYYIIARGQNTQTTVEDHY